MAKSDAVNKYNNSGNLQIVSFILSITLALTELRRIPHQRKTTRRFRFFLRVWRRSGGELYYRSGNKMMVVSVTTSPEFRASAPKQLWEGNYSDGSGASCGMPGVSSSNYDVTSDGQHFLMVRDDDRVGSNRIVVVLNWAEEIKAKV